MKRDDAANYVYAIDVLSSEKKKNVTRGLGANTQRGDPRPECETPGLSDGVYQPGCGTLGQQIFTRLPLHLLTRGHFRFSEIPKYFQLTRRQLLCLYHSPPPPPKKGISKNWGYFTI